MNETEQALDQAMDNLYAETELSREDIEKIRERFWRDHNMVFGEEYEPKT